ncbi:hypothetical protein [Aegicerativicinus sediminis]|uniref:hypothetical protein n=1 Tax=Aegicerativicinus sediminis TaxID=2893202 RepID=UPI001E64222A|nr:hypothetical protein [Aegicerativicinus sediminis]
MKPLNLENRLRKVQYSRKNKGIQEIFEEITNGIEKENSRINSKLENVDNNHSNDFDFDLLESDRIFHISAIRTVCIDYRLRFLDSNFFKGKIPTEALNEIRHLENLHNTELDGFKIMAPSKSLKLENADDPLLFAPITNDYYYLIYKWGKDLHPLRKWVCLPFKNINNTLIFALLSSLLLCLMVPFSVYDEGKELTEFFFLYLFMFKAVGFVIIFFGISRGKNFNSEIWNSKYYNA